MKVSRLLEVIQQVSIKMKRIICFNSQTIVLGTMKRRGFVLGLENEEQWRR